MASFLAGLLGKGAGEGVGAAASGLADGIAKVIGALYTTEGEKLDKELALQRVRQTPALQQVAVDLAEAAHRSVFVAGWRPFIGWVCGGALAYNFIFRDLIVWGFAALGSTMPVPPALQMDQLMTVLLGLLGLGTLRTVEKMGGVTK
jgi:hypothetical protein